MKIFCSKILYNEIIIGWSTFSIFTLVSRDRILSECKKTLKRYKLENADEKNMAENIDFEEWYQKG